MNKRSVAQRAMVSGAWTDGGGAHLLETVVVVTMLAAMFTALVMIDIGGVVACRLSRAVSQMQQAENQQSCEDYSSAAEPLGQVSSPSVGSQPSATNDASAPGVRQPLSFLADPQSGVASPTASSTATPASSPSPTGSFAPDYLVTLPAGLVGTYSRPLSDGGNSIRGARCPENLVEGVLSTGSLKCFGFTVDGNFLPWGSDRLPVVLTKASNGQCPSNSREVGDECLGVKAVQAGAAVQLASKTKPLGSIDLPTDVFVSSRPLNADGRCDSGWVTYYDSTQQRSRCASLSSLSGVSIPLGGQNVAVIFSPGPNRSCPANSRPLVEISATESQCLSAYPAGG